MMALNNNAVEGSIGRNATRCASRGAFRILFFVVLVRRHDRASRVTAWGQHGDVARLLPLFEVIAGNAVVLDGKHTRRCPLAVTAEAVLADIGFELRFVHVVGKLGLVESASRLDALLQ